jgi:hypothetical protein
MILERVVLVEDLDVSPVELRVRVLAGHEWTLAHETATGWVLAVRGDQSFAIPPHRIRYVVPGVERAAPEPVMPPAQQAPGLSRQQRRALGR